MIDALSLIEKVIACPELTTPLDRFQGPQPAQSIDRRDFFAWSRSSEDGHEQNV